MPKNTRGVQVKQIAEHLGLSSGTVSIVLNGRGDELRISKETQKIVLDTAREMNYQSGKNQKKNQKTAARREKFCIGVFWNLHYMGGLLGQFYSGFLETIKQYHAEVEIVLQPFEYDHLNLLEDAFSGKRYDGAIIGGLSEIDSGYLRENTFEIPIVLINQTLENYSSVYVDDYQTGRQCAELFYRNGHKRVGIVSSENRSAASVLRYNGFAEECRKCGIQLKDEWKVTGEGNGIGGYESVRQMLQCRELPTALFVQMSRMSSGILAALRDGNIEVPGQMEIIAYGDGDFSQYLYPTVTVLHVSVAEMAANAMHLVLTILQNDLHMTLSKLHVTKLIYGESFQEKQSERTP